MFRSSIDEALRALYHQSHADYIDIKRSQEKGGEMTTGQAVLRTCARLIKKHFATIVSGAEFSPRTPTQSELQGNGVYMIFYQKIQLDETDTPCFNDPPNQKLVKEKKSVIG